LHTEVDAARDDISRVTLEAQTNVMLKDGANFRRYHNG
jgi:hypothetical protein